MKLLDKIRGLRLVGDTKLQRLIDNAVDERKQMILEHGPSVFTENASSGGDHKLKRIASGGLKDINTKMRKTQEMKEGHITEISMVIQEIIPH